MNEIQFTTVGLAKLSEIVRRARASLSLRDFQEVVGLSFGAIRDLEQKKVKEVKLSTLAKIAPHTPYTFEELLTICTGEEPSLPPSAREFLLADQVLPIIHQLPPEEKRRLRKIDLSSMSNEDLADAMKAIADEFNERLKGS